MGLYEQWMSTAYTEKGQLEKKIWDMYLPKEQKIYEQLLSDKQNIMKGTLKELSEKYEMSEQFFVGFLDGINGALNVQMEPETLEDSSEINIGFEWDVLYKKMVEYKAEHLFMLPEWDNIYSKEEREKLYKEQKTSGTIVNGPKIGRNDPCPCDSGKKYKKCCGA